MALSDLTGATIGHTVYLVGGWRNEPATDGVVDDRRHTFHEGRDAAGGCALSVRGPGSNLVVAGGELANGMETTHVSLVDTTSGKSSSLARLPEPSAMRCVGVRRHRVRRRWTRRRRHRARHRDRNRSYQRQADGSAEDAGSALRFREPIPRRRAPLRRRLLLDRGLFHEPTLHCSTGGSHVSVHGAARNGPNLTPGERPTGRLQPGHRLVTVTATADPLWAACEAFVYEMYVSIGYTEPSPRHRVEELARWAEVSRFHAVLDEDHRVVGTVRCIFGPYAQLPVNQFVRTDHTDPDPVCELSSLVVDPHQRSTGVIEHLYRAGWLDAWRSGSEAVVALIDDWLFQAFQETYRLPFRQIGIGQHYMGTDPVPVCLPAPGPPVPRPGPREPAVLGLDARGPLGHRGPRLGPADRADRRRVRRGTRPRRRRPGRRPLIARPAPAGRSTTVSPRAPWAPGASTPTARRRTPRRRGAPASGPDRLAAACRSARPPTDADDGVRPEAEHEDGGDDVDDHREGTLAARPGDPQVGRQKAARCQRAPPSRVLACPDRPNW